MKDPISGGEAEREHAWMPVLPSQGSAQLRRHRASAPKDADCTHEARLILGLDRSAALTAFTYSC